eukprot:114097-Chlamydomonas_euryale.AAC.1
MDSFGSSRSGRAFCPSVYCLAVLCEKERQIRLHASGEVVLGREGASLSIRGAYECDVTCLC